MNYITGNTIKNLREQKRITQKELADKLCVSDKTVSKWETDRGLPDISIIAELAESVSVSVTELLTGNIAKNNNRSANIMKSEIYVCPLCGNVIYSLGEGSFSCCGISLPKLEAEEENSKHIISIKDIDGEYYITVNHEMSKEHYISFIAYFSGDSMQIEKFYPEQNAECRFRINGHGIIYAYCNRDGLFMTKV